MAPGDAHPYLASFDIQKEGLAPPLHFRREFENLLLPLKLGYASCLAAFADSNKNNPELNSGLFLMKQFRAPTFVGAGA
jgi:hypothetical protein